MLNVSYAPLLKKTNCRQFSWNGVKFELQVLDSLLFTFSKKTFPSAQVLISSYIYKEFCKIPHLAITGHAPLPRFDRILKSVLKQFKKNQKNIKPSRCILIYVLVTIQTNKLGIMQIDLKSLLKM